MSGTPNWSNQTVWTGDNLDVMRGMNSASVDLIYLDPPFNSKANYAAPIGSIAAGAAFKDTWGLDDVNLAWHGLIQHDHPGLYAMLQAVRQIHGDSMMAYLIYMIPRLMEMHRLLKTTGSLYLHCDPTASHYLKLVLDSLFDRKHHRNEIIWAYHGPGSPKMRQFSRKHDVIFWYTKGSTWTYNADAVRVPYKDKNQSLRRSLSPSGSFTAEDVEVYRRRGKMLEDWWPDITTVPKLKRERTGYPTQKPFALLKRIISASSNEGDMVLDPFCGCATTCIAAEALDRQWVGIDINPKAADLVQDRLQRELGMLFKGVHRNDIPKRNDLGSIPPYDSPKNKSYLYGEQGSNCNACGTHFLKQHLMIDHIIPLSKGGTDHISNLQLLCGSCNSTKGNRSQEWLLARLLDKGYIRKQPATQKHSG